MDEEKSAEAGSAHPEESAEASRSTRFAWGVTMGVGMGVLAVLVVGLIWLAPVLSFRSQVAMSDFGPTKLEVVQSSEPWVKMTDATHGQVVGYMVGGLTSASEMPHGAIGDFMLTVPTEQQGVLAYIGVRVLITPDTEVTVGGEPWSPQGVEQGSSGELLFSDYATDDGNDILFAKELTVEFETKDRFLIARRIDASEQQVDMPGSMDSWY